MKNYGKLIISAIVGSGITLVIFLAFVPIGKNTLEIKQISSKPESTAMFVKNEEGKVVPLDFIGAAKKVRPTVVNVLSTQKLKAQANQGQAPDQFQNWNQFYQFFFGPGNQPQQNQPQESQAMGSGVIISKDGYIVTNFHVIQGADDITVTLEDNRVFKGKVIGTDPSTDMALLHIDATDLPALPFANSDDIEVGQWVIAVGNPYTLNSTVTAGIISARARALNIYQQENAIASFIQTDAALNPGNSGGALANLDGGLIGINSAIESPTGSFSGYGFAIPSNIVSRVVEDLMKYGVVKRGYMGVVIRGVTGNFAKQKGLEITQGAYIDSVLAGSAADKAGIKPGDVVTAINGMAVAGASQLQEQVLSYQPGQTVNVTVNRKGKAMNFNVTLQSNEGTIIAPTKERSELKAMLGADFKALNKDEAKKMGIESGVEVTRLFKGKLSSDTDIRVGFIITKVNNHEVFTVDDLLNALQKIKGGVMLEGVYKNRPGVYYYAFGM